MQVVQGKAHTAGRRDRRGPEQSIVREHRGEGVASTSQESAERGWAWEQKTKGSHIGGRVERLGTVLRSLQASPISPLNVKLLVEPMDFHGRV